MSEPVDIFADAIHINMMAFGCTLQFGRSEPVPMAMVAESIPDSILPTERLATIRLTPELMKAMTFLLHRHIVRYEEYNKRKIELPANLMARVLTGSTRELWDTLWGLK